MMEKIEAFLNRFIAPVAKVLGESDAIQSVAEGFTRIVPLTFGVCLFAIIGNLPIDGLNAFLDSAGLRGSIDAVFNAGMNALALFVSFTIAYAYARRKGENALSAGLLSTMSFLVIIPQAVAGAEGDVRALPFDYLGGNGLLAALVIGLLVGVVYCLLAKTALKFKMPEGVPPMVASSLEPMVIAVAIAVMAFAIRYGFSLTPFGDFVSFFQAIIGGTLAQFTLSVPFLIGVLFLSDVFWFFGIHPNTITSPLLPMLLLMATTNISDFAAGNPMTYLLPGLAFYFAGLGGNGNTIGLSLCMLTAKSKRYKQMTKIGFVPSLFNINEPLIFGMPLMLNPIFFIPMTCSCILMSLVGLGLFQLVPFAYNPSAGLLPFAVPYFVNSFIGGGIVMLAISTICVLAGAALYYPFFRIADKKACEEEAAAEAEASAALAGEALGE